MRQIVEERIHPSVLVVGSSQSLGAKTAKKKTLSWFGCCCREGRKEGGRREARKCVLDVREVMSDVTTYRVFRVHS